MLRPEAPSPKPRHKLSLRLKLTLWMVLIFLVVQLSLGFVLQLYQRRSVDEFFDARILARLDQLRQTLEGRTPGVTHEQLADLVENYRKALLQKYMFVELFDESGRPIVSSRPATERLPDATWSAAQTAQEPRVISLPQSFTGDSEGDSRAAATWMNGPDGHRVLLVVGWSDMYAREILRLLSGVTFFSIPIGLVAAVISAYVIASIAVRPIRAMRTMARGLEPESLGKRVPLSGSGLELTELQQDLERTRQKLEAAFSVQERFMSNVSHELKTPIAVLMTEAQTLKLDTASKDVHAFVASAMDELEKLGRMVDSFLLLTRVRHGKSRVPNPEHCLARDIMVQSYEGCAAMAAQYGVRISMTLPADEHLDVGVHGNCDLLRTILDNLIRNAIRFSPKNSIVYAIGRADGDRLLICVRDSGPGIPTSLLPRIFDRFAQSSEEQRRGRGHGLGLEIAMGITELHGGTITAINRPEGGCEFTVSLPLAPENRAVTPGL